MRLLPAQPQERARLRGSMTERSIRRICVFCGSSSGARPAYLEAARALGSLLGAQGIGVVYGGAHVGLMGAVADAARAAGSEVIGVIPQSLVEREVAHTGLADLRVVGSMHERKALMAELSDAFIALPGGIGTLEELFEIWTWAQLGSHQKPCGLLNADGFYDRLLGFLDHVVSEAFLRQQHRDMLLVAREPRMLLEKIQRYEPPALTKWIRPGEE
jgi:uncharacterized protein (TIGR00730 family)